MRVHTDEERYGLWFLKMTSEVLECVNKTIPKIVGEFPNTLKWDLFALDFKPSVVGGKTTCFEDFV